MTTKTAADKIDQTRPMPQGYFAGVPYDLRRPTVQKLKARWWNKDNAHFFTPKTYGAGWDFNLYWAVHPRAFAKERQSS
jgi:hypothetical protein